ncbi:MAG: class I SAM-dependent methyltransferase [Burkholderiales bacterium]
MQPRGDSAAPRELIFHIIEEGRQSVSVLDIGFGEGHLAQLIKSSPLTHKWSVDGIDGWEPNCANQNLVDKRLYRHIWHGLAQKIPAAQLADYDIICLLDVIEHLNVDSAKWLLRTLLNNLGDNSFLFVSTPLWFYPQEHVQSGDLEEHLIGVPATSMMSLLPVVYAINHPLVGGFVYRKRSLDYIDFFQPYPHRSFSYEMGANILRAINIDPKPGVLFRTGF